MRTFVLLSLLGVAAANPALVQTGECLVDSGSAVSDATDAALFIWAASKRCPKGKSMEVKCEVDVTSAVKSAVGMIDVILKSVSKCGQLPIQNEGCATQATQMTEHSAGIAAAIGDAYQKCVNVSAPVEPTTTPVKCVVDLKGSAKGVFKITKMLTDGVKCEGGEKECAADVLNLVGAVAGMGQYIAGAVGQCNRSTALNPNATAQPEQELCAAAIIAVLDQASQISNDGIKLSEKCAPVPAPAPVPVAVTEPAPAPAPAPPPRVISIEVAPAPARLYEQDDEEDTGSNMNLVLGAFLPVTAMVGFVGGRFYATRDPRNARIAGSTADEQNALI